jgi:hypothetical protein
LSRTRKARIDKAPENLKVDAGPASLPLLGRRDNRERPIPHLPLAASQGPD